MVKINIAALVLLIAVSTTTICASGLRPLHDDVPTMQQDGHHRALFGGLGNDNLAPPQKPDFNNGLAGAPDGHENDPGDHVENVRKLMEAIAVRCWRDMGKLYCMM